VQPTRQGMKNPATKIGGGFGRGHFHAENWETEVENSLRKKKRKREYFCRQMISGHSMGTKKRRGELGKLRGGGSPRVVRRSGRGLEV